MTLLYNFDNFLHISGNLTSIISSQIDKCFHKYYVLSCIIHKISTAFCFKSESVSIAKLIPLFFAQKPGTGYTPPSPRLVQTVSIIVIQFCPFNSLHYKWNSAFMSNVAATTPVSSGWLSTFMCHFRLFRATSGHKASELRQDGSYTSELPSCVDERHF